MKRISAPFVSIVEMFVCGGVSGKKERVNGLPDAKMHIA